TPGESKVGPAPAATTRLDYVLVVRDAQDNELYRRGTPERPASLALAADYGLPATHADPPPSPAAYYLASGLLAAGGVAAAGVGAYFTVQREQAASEWNSSSCEQPG